MNGFLVINKKKGMTSHDVVAKVRYLLKTKKVGHTGTLDPETEGVLVLAINKATKLINVLEEKHKTYYATATIGISTETEDIYGKIIGKSDASKIKKEDVLKAIDILKTQKEQIPPMYSAVKVKGKKLYEYARANIVVERKPRPISIYRLELQSDIRYNDDNTISFDLLIEGSKGIYVRTLIYDLARILHQEGCMSYLKRLQSGFFTLEQAYTLEDVENNQFHLIDVLDVFKDYPTINVNSNLAKMIQNGIVLDSRQIKTDSIFKVFFEGNLIAIYEPFAEYQYKPVVLF